MALIDIKVPNIGDFKDVEIIEILVSNGQNINKGDSMITLESDKSSVEVPCNNSGKVSQIYVKVGDKVSEGDLILKIESNKNETIKIETTESAISKEIQNAPKKILEKSQAISNIKDITTSNKSILASPKVRKFARELGADISKISGSEKLGRVTEEDVKNFVNFGLQQKQSVNNNQEIKEFIEFIDDISPDDFV